MAVHANPVFKSTYIFHRIAIQQHRFKNVQIAYDVCFFNINYISNIK